MTENFEMLETAQLELIHQQIHGKVDGGGEDCITVRNQHDYLAAELIKRGVSHDTAIVCPDPVTNAPNYQRGFTDDICINCAFGQLYPYCNLYKFDYIKDFTCDSFRYFEVLELEPPHGFLMTNGKQTALASIEKRDVDKAALIISNGEVFGITEFEQPAQLGTKDFDSDEWQNKHRITQRERRQWWPDATAFYVYPLKAWYPYEGVKLFEDGRVIDEPKLSSRQWQIISKSKNLPKQVILNDAAVSITDTSEFIICKEVASPQLDSILVATYETEVKAAKEANETIPVYSLALVRNPRMRVSKKNIIAEATKTNEVEKPRAKQEGDNMPFGIVLDDGEYCVINNETDERLGCHETEAEAEEQLTALRINVEEGEAAVHPKPKKPKKPKKKKEREFELVTDSEGNVSFGEKEESIEQQLNFIRQQFDDEFNEKNNEASSVSSSLIWIVDIFDSFIIVDDDRRLFRVHYMETDEDIVFTPRLSWVEVERGYAPKGFKLLAHDEKQVEVKQQTFDESEWDGSAARWDTADAYCSDSLIDVNSSGEEKIKGLCKLPFRNPGSTNPNKAALRAIVGGRGITRIEKPADVSGDEWDTKLKAAANKLIGWWSEAFDQPAPESVFLLAGKTRPKEKKGFMDSLRGMYKSMADFLTLVDGTKEMESNKLFTGNIGIAQKMVAGELWHFTWSTNAFEDRDGEIFSTKALESYVVANEKNKDRGYFNLWHINEEDGNFNSDFARKEWQGVEGRILIEAGPYLRNEKGRAARKFFKKFYAGHPVVAPEGWGCSPEYKYLPEERVTGTYENIWITKTSTLSRMSAANIWTNTRQMKRGTKKMALTDQQRTAANEMFGSDFVDDMLQEALDKTAELEASGIAHKDKNVVETEVKGVETEVVEKVAEETTQEIEPKTEEKQPEPVTEVTMTQNQFDVLAEAVADKFKVNNNAVVEAMGVIAQGLATVGERVATLEKKGDAKQRAEVPTYTFELQRASEDKETVVTDDDDLKGKKPAEASGPPKTQGEVTPEGFFATN